jgi:hypothetical protein
MLTLDSVADAFATADCNSKFNVIVSIFPTAPT